MSSNQHDPDFVVAALGAQRSFAEQFRLETRNLKPCIAVLLDGNLGAADRHDAAFCIAIELRRMGLLIEQARVIVAWWAKSIGYRVSQAERCLRSAYQQSADGTYRYRPPGLHKTSVRYGSTLGPICATIGCPPKCTPLADIHRRGGDGSYHDFCRVGWPAHLRKARQRVAFDVYRAVCELEQRHGFPEGAPMFTSYDRIARIAEVNKGSVGRGLRVLADFELIVFEAGSGSGPRARDRKGSKVQRIIPIKPPQTTPISPQ